MGSTPNLLLAHIVASQNQKEVTANASADGFDEALCGYTSIAMSDANYTFATGAGSLGLSNMVFIFTGAITADRNIVLPPNSKPYIVKNATTGGHSLIFKVVTAAHTVTLSDSLHHLLHCDGLNSVYEIGVSGAVVAARTDALTDFLGGVPGSSQVMFRIPVAFAYTFPANFSGSEANVLVAASATTVFSVQKNGVEFGTITFYNLSPVSTVGVFAMDASPAVPVTFEPGDILSVVAPASPDATLAGLGFQLVATRPY
jgi:hypothetical protein